MTESDWLICRDPLPMLEHLGEALTERKRRLYCCACCRRVWELLRDPASRLAVELAEEYADGRVAERDFHRARSKATAAAGPAAMAAYWTIKRMTDDVVLGVVEGVANAVSWSAGDAARHAGEPLQNQLAAYDDAAREIRAALADLLRELVGNPFRPVQVEPAWLLWNAGSASRLAQAIHSQNRLDELPLLADALEEAGCDDPAVLAHLRGPGDHVRGCWALDALLLDPPTLRPTAHAAR